MGNRGNRNMGSAALGDGGRKYTDEELWAAVKDNDAARVETIIDSGLRPQEASADGWDGATVLMTAARHGNLAIVERLLSAKAPPDDRDSFGFTALIWAAQNGRSLEVVRKLIKAKADPNLFSTNVRQSAVNAAAERGHLRFVAYLLKRRADPRHRSNGNTAILVAASHGHIDIVKHLLDHPKVDIDSQNLEDGRTPLIWAVDLGNIDLLKLLLTEGANFYFRDDDRVSAIWYALRHPDAVDFLCRSNLVDSSLPDEGLSWLMLATLAGIPASVKVLLEMGSSVDYVEPKHNYNVQQVLRHRGDFWRPGWLRAHKFNEAEAPRFAEVGRHDDEIAHILRQANEAQQVRRQHERLKPLFDEVQKHSSMAPVVCSLVIRAIQSGFPIRAF